MINERLQNYCLKFEEEKKLPIFPHLYTSLYTIPTRAGNFLDRSENGGIVEPFRAS